MQKLRGLLHAYLGGQVVKLTHTWQIHVGDFGPRKLFQQAVGEVTVPVARLAAEAAHEVKVRSRGVIFLRGLRGGRIHRTAEQQAIAEQQPDD